jgi:hypothetical protein
MKLIKPILFALLLISLMCAAHWLPSNKESTESAVSVREDARDASMQQAVDKYQPK